MGADAKSVLRENMKKLNINRRTAMKKSKRDKFFEMCGEYPEDMFGEDWENYIDEWFEEQEEEIFSNKFGK